MKNKHSWHGATAYDHHGLNDMSSSGRSEGKSMNSRGHAHPTRSEKMTSPMHKAATPDSEAWPAIPNSTPTHPLLGVKSEMSSGHVGDGKMKHAPVSGSMTLSADPKESMGKRWKTRGYAMETPSSESAGTMRKKH